MLTMNLKRTSLLARGYFFVGRNLIAARMIDFILDSLAFLDFRMVILLSMWHPNMNKRRKLLKKRGVNIADTAFVDMGAFIEVTTPQAVTIEDYAVVGQGCVIIAHDTSLNTFSDMPLKVKPTRIGYNAAIAPRAIIMPGVDVGDNSGVTMGSVVTKDVPEGVIVAGNPAKVIANVSDVIEKWQDDMKTNPNIYYDHPQPWRAPDNPFDEFITWRKENVDICKYTDIKTNSPFDYIIEAKNMKKKS